MDNILEAHTIIYLLIAVINGVICGLATQTDMNAKGYYSNHWFWLGFLLTGLGVLISASCPSNVVMPGTVNAAARHSSDPLASQNVWKCSKCGAINPAFSGSCPECGTLKPSKPNSKEVWRCVFCGTENTGNEPYSRCKCGKTRKQSDDEAKAKSVRLKKTASADSQRASNLENLKKLKELLDMGALTQEEYDKKKAELLK